MGLKQNCEKCWYKDKAVKDFEKDFMKLIEGYRDEIISTSYVCIKNRGMHNAVLDVQISSFTNIRTLRVFIGLYED